MRNNPHWRLRRLSFLVLMVSISACKIKDQLCLSSLRSIPVSAELRFCASDCTQVLWRGNLQDQTRACVEFSPDADGDFLLQWAGSDGTSQNWRGGYTTPNAGLKVDFLILDNDTVQMDSR